MVRLGGLVSYLAGALCLLASGVGHAQSSGVATPDLFPTTGAVAPYVICKNQTYALCAAASSFVYAELAYAKCQVKRGNSISAPPLNYSTTRQSDAPSQQNICTFNAEGVGNGYMASTYSVPPSILKNNPNANQALYTCPGGSEGSYAQCDGGTCFTSTIGKSFPGIGKLNNDEIVCSCPITKTSHDPFGYQFVGPYPCQKEAFKNCTKAANTSDGSIIPVGAPTGAGRYLSIQLTGRNPEINMCFQ